MIRQLTQEMAQSLCAAPEIEQKMEQLVGQLETVKGKKSYGYLPESVKKTVDEVVDKLEELLVVRECYDQWCILQNEVENYCHDKPRERKKLAQEKKFRQIKNAIIQEAENIRLGVMTFEDEKVEDREWILLHRRYRCSVPDFLLPQKWHLPAEYQTKLLFSCSRTGS